MNLQLQERLIKYALQQMREQIHATQSKIMDLEQRTELFPESALSDFGARLGRPKSLAYEAEGSRSEHNDAILRLAVLQTDYTEVQALWQEFQDKDLAATLRGFWKGANEN